MSLSQVLRTLTHGLLAVAISLGSVPRSSAAEQLLVRFSGLQLPLDLNELEAWALRPQANPELGPWLNLLDQQTRQDLQRLLQQPLNLENSTIALLLESWAGRQLVLQLGSLLRSANGDGGPLLRRFWSKSSRSGPPSPSALRNNDPSCKTNCRPAQLSKSRAMVLFSKLRGCCNRRCRSWRVC